MKTRPHENSRSTPARPTGLSRPAVLSLAGWVAMMVIFTALSWSVSTRTCATYDEPLHAGSGWAELYHHDFRVDPEDPPLWKYWAALANGRESLKADWNTQAWRELLVDHDWRVTWTTSLLYRTPGNDGAAFIQRGRGMLLLVGIALGALIAAWAWKLGGAAAGAAAAAMYGFDPNFIAHAALVKNDVAFSLALLASVWAAWAVGRRATLPRVASLCLSCGIALTVKFSAPILAPIVIILLLARALSRRPWRVLRWELSRRLPKAGAAAAICVVAALAGWASIWAAYGFRYSTTPDPAQSLNMDQVLQMTASRHVQARHPGMELSDAQAATEIAAWKPGVFERTALFASRHRLLPEPFVYGLLYTRASALFRPTYLCGEYSNTGWWYYFPAAMLFKTPSATIIAFVVVAVIVATWLVTALWRRGQRDYWTWLCLAVPAMLYAIAAMSTNLNLGLRHALPLYPLLMIGAAVVFARMYAKKARAAVFIAMLLFIALAAETLAAFPHYIAFFNAPSNYVGPLHLLGDSNLDWGQDLPLLAEWQKKHSGTKLYLAYFGSVDPGFYGIDFTPMPGGYAQGRQPQWPAATGVLAVSATRLQSIYGSDELRGVYLNLMSRRPMAVLGKTIYLYEFPPGSPGGAEK